MKEVKRRVVAKKVPECVLLSSGVEEGRCTNHKCTRTATAQGSRMSASLRMDGALHSAGAAYSFSGAEPLPEPHGGTRCEPLRVCAAFQLRSSLSPLPRVCLRRSESWTNGRLGALPLCTLGEGVQRSRANQIQHESELVLFYCKYNNIVWS